MPFRRAVLDAIAAGEVDLAFRRWERPRVKPGTRAADLAASLGRETLPFKRDVRKLKELGLSESLEVGYRVPPRGRALLSRI